VIEWLVFLKKEWIRIDAEDVIDINFCGDEIELITITQKVNLSNITSYWYRRGFLNFKNHFLTSIRQFDYVLTEEIDNFINYIHYKLSKTKNINSIHDDEKINKLIVSDIARQLGIDTPDDLIFSDKASLESKIKNSNNKFITKITSGRPISCFNDFSIFNYTKIVELEKIPEAFFPSLVQNHIEKRYELRIFYLDGDFFSMAIFSQSENQTSIDFRNVNKQKINRCVPFKLPNGIEHKLDLLMRELGLNSGSIDMIVTPKYEYIFLEVNPVGQFGMTSYPCNYNLEKEIANYL